MLRLSFAISYYALLSAVFATSRLHLCFPTLERLPQIEAFAASYRAVLSSVVADPSTSVGALSVLAPEQRATLDAFNDTFTPEFLGETVVELFARVVEGARRCLL